MLDQVLSELRDKYITILKDNLVGIYLHGSIVFKCFNPKKSDIDFLVVVNDKINESTQKRLIEVLLDLDDIGAANGFEMSVVLKEHCLDFKYPTPYELHYSKAWKTEYFKNPDILCKQNCKSDPDLAAHFMVIKDRGEVLYGSSINTVFGDIRKDYYIDSIVRDIETAEKGILSDPSYFVLNLCRVLAYLKENRILSKAEGGIWALEVMPVEYHDLIQSCLASYSYNHEIFEEDMIKLEFARYSLALISTDLNNLGFNKSDKLYEK